MASELTVDQQREAERALYERTDTWLSKKFKEESHDSIVKPAHYNIGGIEPAEFMESLGIAEDGYAYNVIKYISRYKMKNGIEDVRKARQYCNMLIDLLESEQSSDAN
jgi:hypothetical protein